MIAQIAELAKELPLQIHVVGLLHWTKSQRRGQIGMASPC